MITYIDFINSFPILIIAIASLLVIIIESILPSKGKSETPIYYFSIVVVLVAIYFSLFDLNKNILLFTGFLRLTQLTAFLNLTILIGLLITILASKNYLTNAKINFGEYYSLIFISVLGMLLMINANDLLILFIGIEIMSVCFYILTGFNRSKVESNESALKYFLLGAFITGFLLLGIAFVYGTIGSTNYGQAANFKSLKDQFYMIGIILIFVAFLFKTGSFPLQMWVPDVYQGAPTIVTGLMSSLGKTAAFGAMITFFQAFGITSITMLIAVISIITMLYGNVLALLQTNIKRLLAYSSIAHAGYILIGFLIINPISVNAILLYLISYVLMQLGAFIILGILEKNNNDDKSITDLNHIKGLGKTNPWLASMLTIFLLSLAGIPPLAGFWGKYYIFYSAILNNFVWMAIVGILLSLVGVYYYIKVILFMWFYEPDEEFVLSRYKLNLSFTASIISTVGLFLIGLYPQLILNIFKFIVL